MGTSQFSQCDSIVEQLTVKINWFISFRDSSRKANVLKVRAVRTRPSEKVTLESLVKYS